MRKQSAAWFVLFWAIFLVLISTVVVAQSEKQPSEQAEASKDSPDFVYTTDYLKKRVAETEEKTTGVTNKTLDEQFAEPVQTAGTAFTNDDLQDRFGEEGEAAAGDETSDTEEPADPAAETEPTEPAMSDAERAELIAELETKIGELQQQLDELREE